MKLKKHQLSSFINILAAIGAITTACAQQDNALIDALVKKGVLSNQEAKEITVKEQENYNTTAANKISMASSIKSITFYGDIRLRAEMRSGDVRTGDINSSGQVYGHNDSQTRDRWRYRLRFGLKGDLYENFFYGMRAATNAYNDRSGNVSFGDTDSAGPFGKGKSILAIDQVYLGWKPTDYLTLTGGKMPNPLYTTSMVWSDDLNPEGAAEQLSIPVGDAEVFATAGQFVYGDSADNSAFVGVGQNYSDIFMFAEQIGFKYKFDKDTSFKMAATMTTYSGSSNGDNLNGTVAGLYSTSPANLAAPNNSPSYFTGPFVGAGSAPATNSTGIDNLAVLETPMEFDFKVGKVPMRVFGDFAFNFDANQRADAARNAINTFAATGTNNTGITAAVPLAGQTQAQANSALLNSNGVQGVLNTGKRFLDQAAYQVGVEAGQLKKKGDWDGKLYWQSTGYYAVDPNLNDSDIFNAATNLEGVVVSVSHNWMDGVSSTLRYAYANPVNGQLATPNYDQDLQISTIHNYNLFQADLMWKF